MASLADFVLAVLLPLPRSGLSGKNPCGGSMGREPHGWNTNSDSWVGIQFEYKNGGGPNYRRSGFFRAKLHAEVCADYFQNLNLLFIPLGQPFGMDI
jgi:hypothetical protein